MRNIVRPRSCAAETGMAALAESDGGSGEYESLSHRAEVFRSKLIEDFQILDCVTEEGREKAPVYNSSDATSKYQLTEFTVFFSVS